MGRCILVRSILGGVAAMLIGGAAAQAQMPPVNRVTAAARPAHYDGRCPASIEFVGTIFMNYQATVSYRWERSDGASGPVETVVVQGPRQGAVTRWQLRRPVGEVFQGVETLHVLSPIDIYSNPAKFQMVCRT
jgi:hypothetical protein